MVKSLPILFTCLKKHPKMVGMGNGMSGCHQFLVESPRCRRARARLHRAAEAHDVETMIRRGGKGFCFFLGTNLQPGFFSVLNTFVE